VSRRDFLAATGVALASAPNVAILATATVSKTMPAELQDARANIPIGVFDPIFFHLSLDAMLERMSALGLEAIEVAVGGYPSTPHCPVADILSDQAKARAWRKKFEDRNIRLGAFSAHGNPLHPNANVARRDDALFRRAILMAERLDVPVVVGFSGCPGDSNTSQHPNWITYRWPDDYQEVVEWQWKEKVIPYWREMVKFARQHGVRRLAFEMHPGFVVYNPWTLLRLREAVGEEIGANNDLSHLFWQGCDPVEVIRLLGKQGALFHAHMKDTVILRENVAKFGILNFVPSSEDFRKGSMTFRTVGYGHGAEVWKEIVSTYMDVAYQGILSIENEDPILNGDDGVERAAYVLKNVRAELLSGKT
jgi:sugar phosphate isomerase/epimerase